MLSISSINTVSSATEGFVMFRVTSNRSALSAGRAISVDIRAIFLAAAKSWGQLHKALSDTYRPELHYMRGPGPKWREKHGALQTTRSGAVLNRPIRCGYRNRLCRLGHEAAEGCDRRST